MTLPPTFLSGFHLSFPLVLKRRATRFWIGAWFFLQGFTDCIIRDSLIVQICGKIHLTDKDFAQVDFLMVTKSGGLSMADQNVAQAGTAEIDYSMARDAVYEATDAAIEALEKAYMAKVSKVPVSENRDYEGTYASKSAIKVSIYETASRAITSMAVVASDKKIMIAATAVATIRQIRWS